MLCKADLEDIISVIDCDPYGIRILDSYDTTRGWHIQITLVRRDTVTGEIGEGHGGKYYISPYSTKSEIVQKILGACLAYAEHEVRENFYYKGRQVFGPHFDVDVLWEAAAKPSDARKSLTPDHIAPLKAGSYHDQVWLDTVANK